MVTLGLDFEGFRLKEAKLLPQYFGTQTVVTEHATQLPACGRVRLY